MYAFMYVLPSVCSTGGKTTQSIPTRSQQTYPLSHHIDALTPSITMAQWLVRPLAAHRQKERETVGRVIHAIGFD